MGYYSDNFRRRIPVTVINTGGTATVDFTVLLPNRMDEFWDVIDSSGYELRLTAADGTTLLDYEMAGWTYATKTGTLRADAAPANGVADEVLLYWLYFDTSAAVGDGAVAVTIASAETGYIEQAQPSWVSRVVRPQRPGRSRPADVVLKSTIDDLDVWLDVSQILELRRSPGESRNWYEEPFTVELTAEDQSGSASTSIIDADDCRWAEVYGRGNRSGRTLYLRCRITAGSDGTNYTIKPKLSTRAPNVTGVHRVIESGMRFGVRVTNQVEPAT